MKVIFQVASRALHIETHKIHISETNTQCVPNTSPTAASCGSDLNGMAVMVSTIIILVVLSVRPQQYGCHGEYHHHIGSPISQTSTV